jgi:hypothetical protein
MLRFVLTEGRIDVAYSFSYLCDLHVPPLCYHVSGAHVRVVLSLCLCRHVYLSFFTLYTRKCMLGGLVKDLGYGTGTCSISFALLLPL